MNSIQTRKELAVGEVLKWCWKKLTWLIDNDKAGAWTAIFTGVLAVFTYFLWQVAKSSDETVRASQRAYVSYGGITGGPKQIDAVTGKVVGVEILVPWNNSGTTPARNARTRVTLRLLPYELPDDFDFPDAPSSDSEIRAFVIGPKGSSSVPFAIQMDALRQVQEQKTHLFVWGWAAYRDIFPSSPIRLTEFCNEIIDVKGTKADIADPSGEIHWAAIACPAHNCFDEDCPDYRTRAQK